MDIPLDPTQGLAFLLAAVLLPLLISVIKQTGLSTQANAIIAIIVYVAFGIVGVLAANLPITAENAVPLVIAGGLAGRLAYSMFWSLIGGDEEGNGSIDDRLTKATSVVKGD